MPLVFTNKYCLFLLFFMHLNPLLGMQANENSCSSDQLTTLDISEKLIITRYINPLAKSICIWPKPQNANAISVDQAVTTDPLEFLIYRNNGKIRKIVNAKFGKTTNSLIILSVEKILSLWDLSSKSPRLINSHNNGPAHKTPSILQFNSNRSLLALGFTDGSIQILDTDTLKLLFSYNPSKDRIRSIVFSRNDLFLTATTHNTIFFWQLHENSFKILCKIRFEDKENATSITLKPSRFLSRNATISYDLAIKLITKDMLNSTELTSTATLKGPTDLHITFVCSFDTITKKIVCLLPGNQRFTGYFA